MTNKGRIYIVTRLSESLVSQLIMKHSSQAVIRHSLGKQTMAVIFIVAIAS